MLTCYHVWFNLKPDVDEAEGLAAVELFLQSIVTAREALRFSLSRNTAAPPRSRLPRYHAVVTYESGEALSASIKHQAQRGIHTGPHGAMVSVVTDFHVEVFAEVTQPQLMAACEI